MSMFIDPETGCKLNVRVTLPNGDQAEIPYDEIGDLLEDEVWTEDASVRETVTIDVTDDVQLQRIVKMTMVTESGRRITWNIANPPL